MPSRALGTGAVYGQGDSHAQATPARQHACLTLVFLYVQIDRYGGEIYILI